MIYYLYKDQIEVAERRRVNNKRRKFKNCWKESKKQINWSESRIKSMESEVSSIHDENVGRDLRWYDSIQRRCAGEGEEILRVLCALDEFPSSSLMTDEDRMIKTALINRAKILEKKVDSVLNTLKEAAFPA